MMTSVLVLAGLLTGNTPSPSLSPAMERFAPAAVAEVPDFQKHVSPLFGRLGCNGRACHGSFQGQGGFRLSLFGYDFAADHGALAGGESPRINVETPGASKILEKATTEVPHKGGKRMATDSWQYRLIAQWIKGGARSARDPLLKLERLEVSPPEFVFPKPGEKAPVRIIAHWADGSNEDVTCLCRFRSNDESIVEISEDGLVTAKGKGDSEVVAFYDKGVAVAHVIVPVSERLGPNYPSVPTRTKVDELVQGKLKKLGVVPSDVCSDAEFLRRASLDITATLPTPKEVEAFLADPDPKKRAKKVDELLNRPAYAAWWATQLCDITGNNPRFQVQFFRGELSRVWHLWMQRRLEENAPYDQIVAGLVEANGRRPGQNFEDYAVEMSSYIRKTNPADFAERPDMPLFWAQDRLRQPENKARQFAYSFLGVRLECAECHKHPFDQWSQGDFKDFTAYFGRISYGVAPDSRRKAAELNKELGLEGLRGRDLVQRSREVVDATKPYPWREVFVSAPAANPMKSADKITRLKKADAVRSANKPRLLGEESTPADESGDPRSALMAWLRQPENPYFASAIVNRVWARYFGRGIIDPPDDHNLANPPTNPELLDWLAKGFVKSGFDLKWLHREIVNSDAYQRSWRPNDTNKSDTRNFSHAIPRRLPAEVAYDAIVSATAADPASLMTKDSLISRAIAADAGVKAGGQFALRAFGKPPRVTTCDCERSNQPNLVQSIYLRNDQDVFALLGRSGGWLAALEPDPEKRPIAESPIRDRAMRKAAKAETPASAEPAKASAPALSTAKPESPAMAKTPPAMAKTATPPVKPPATPAKIARAAARVLAAPAPTVNPVELAQNAQKLAERAKRLKSIGENDFAAQVEIERTKAREALALALAYSARSLPTRIERLKSIGEAEFAAELDKRLTVEKKFLATDAELAKRVAALINAAAKPTPAAVASKSAPAATIAKATPASAPPAAKLKKPEGPKTEDLIREAYLRTVSRPPTAPEMAIAMAHVREAPTTVAGLGDVFWALLNTKEFIVNH